ncbi:MAG: quinone-dependent dihydroorotate dehydrogenase [Alphaproteobacteria bacterium]|nr:quinone-dependent dihydroorotate dehydrogenase [Alphaproteobacteria bacterium]
MYPLLRPLLFSMDPERAHRLSLHALRVGGSNPVGRASIRALYAPRKQQPVEVFGLRFPNALGLAAGYDKDGLGWRGLAAMGFGHVEVGTVTVRAQAGNPKPRVFRLQEDRAVINRLGFPGLGADFVAARLAGGERPCGVILGVNVGKNKDTPLEDAASDYVPLVERFAALADYLVVNVSSPNTPQLRELQTGAALRALLTTVRQARDARAQALGRSIPLLVKLAPDLDDAALDDALGAVDDAAIDGVIATNTTISREGLRSPHKGEAGGLSGAPLTAMSTALIHKIVQRCDKPVIAVGGVMGLDDARAKLDAGAKLVQVYTGLVYGGPGLVRDIVEGLAAQSP